MMAKHDFRGAFGIPTSLFAVFVAGCWIVAGDSASGQNLQPSLNQTVQLPVLSFFNVRTVVSAPDGGVMSLGGINRHRSSSSSNGVPAMFGRPFVNRAVGFEGSSNQAWVKPRIIVSGELESEVMAEAQRRIRARESRDPNGPAAVQRKADFISRHIGRNQRR